MSISEILSMISLISFILAGVSAALAVIFWFRFNIPAVIGDLSGRTARKSIEKMRANNEKTGKKDFAPSKTNLERGKLTGLMKETENGSEKLSGKLSGKIVGKKKDATVAPVAPVVSEKQMETALLDEETGLLTESEETELLNDDVMETEFLGDTELLEEIEETGLLVEENETMLLTNESQQVALSNNGVFTMIEEIMFIHTDETID